MVSVLIVRSGKVFCKTPLKRLDLQSEIQDMGQHVLPKVWFDICVTRTFRSCPYNNDLAPSSLMVEHSLTGPEMKEKSGLGAGTAVVLRLRVNMQLMWALEGPRG